jgi:hypothetical protein
MSRCVATFDAEEAMTKGVKPPQKSDAEMIAKLRAQGEASSLRRLRAMDPDRKIARQLIDAGYKALALKVPPRQGRVP